MTKPFPGVLIVLEGIDGSGKSTAAHALYDAFKQVGVSVLLTKEPGDTQLGKQIRVLLQEQPVPVRPEAEFLLFAADRAQHIHDIVRPALMRGDIVISDRLHYSSECYQGAGRNLDRDIIQRVNKWVMGDVHPDVVVYIKIDVDTAFKRIHARGERRTSFEQEEFITRVVQAFDTLFMQKSIQGTQVIVVDGAQSPEQVAENIFDKVSFWLRQNKNNKL